MVDAKSFCKNSQFQLENSFAWWMPRLERCEANLPSKFCGPHQKICEFRPLLLSGQSGSDSSTLLLKPSDYAHNNAVLLRNHGRPRFWELFFVLGILKDKNNSLVFINRNSFSGRISYLLIESFLPYQKIAISSGVVEFSRVLALQQKLLFESWSSSLGPRVYDD